LFLDTIKATEPPTIKYAPILEIISGNWKGVANKTPYAATKPKPIFRKKKMKRRPIDSIQRNENFLIDTIESIKF
jgi:hypothetical protein